MATAEEAIFLEQYKYDWNTKVEDLLKTRRLSGMEECINCIKDEKIKYYKVYKASLYMNNMPFQR